MQVFLVLYVLGLNSYIIAIESIFESQKVY
jgi:hypothetical protein